MSKAIDMSGSKFGRLYLLSREVYKGTTHYLCLCSCGKIKRISWSNIQSGSIQSCGCFKSEMRRLKNWGKRKETMVNRIWVYYKRNARNRKLDWNLTKEDFSTLIFGNCIYCGIEPTTINRSKYYDFFIKNNGVDRKDSKSGYEVDNCVSCCKTCNLAKSSMETEEFVMYIKKLYNAFGKGV